MKPTLYRMVAPVLALVGAAVLAACSEKPERTFETRTEDKSGGEFIVTDANREGVEVELPKTEMTPVPPGEAAVGPERSIDVMDKDK